jgi:hypothetical protein
MCAPCANPIASSLLPVFRVAGPVTVKFWSSLGSLLPTGEAKKYSVQLREYLSKEFLGYIKYEDFPK